MGDQRCFVALEIPSSARAALFAQYGAHLDPARLRVVAEPDLHVTLLFLGPTPVGKATAYKRALADLDFPSFDAAVYGAGSFGSRVLFAKMATGAPQVRALHGAVCALLGKGGDLPPKKRFSPHLTLARNPHEPPAYLARQVARMRAQKEPVCFRAARVQLLSSRSGGESPHYAELFGVSLLGRGPRAPAPHPG